MRRKKRLFSFLTQWRPWTIQVFFVLIYVTLAGHLYGIQVEERSYYSAKAQSQIRSSGHLAASRGTIFFQDRNGTLLPAAVVKDMPALYAVPREIADPGATALALAETFEALDRERVLAALDKPDDPFEPLLSQLSESDAERARQLDLPGIYVDTEPRRYYPNHGLASHAVGFVAPTAEDDALRGRYGIEARFEDFLRGEDGYVSDDDGVIAPRNGASVVLTLDINIQRRAEGILDSLVKGYRAKGGSVIVQEPKSGKILALANYPNYEPNAYGDYALRTFFNDTVQGVYEPGSIFKVITMAAGLDAGKITPETTYYDRGEVTLNGHTIRNWDLKARGTLTMTEVIENSVNTGSIFAQQQIGEQLFADYVSRFGFDGSTGIELPGEVPGNIDNLHTTRDINFATASFGQGISVTPLALITAVSAIANGGMLMRPYLVERIERQDGAEIFTQPVQVRDVIGKRAARQVTDMMVSSVVKNVLADIPQYTVAGKTGTAQVPNLTSGGYYTDRVINTYAGFAPASDPAFVALIKLNEPEGAPLAGQTVVPAFKDLAEYILNYYQIPPDKPQS